MRLVSIMGDSISTYAGFQPDGYAVYYDNTILSMNPVAGSSVAQCPKRRIA